MNQSIKNFIIKSFYLKAAEYKVSFPLQKLTFFYLVKFEATFSFNISAILKFIHVNYIFHCCKSDG